MKRVLNVFLFFVSVIYCSYLFYVQCIRHPYYETRAKNQHEKKFVLFGARGNIYDCNGLPLATSQQCFSIFCTPRYASDHKRLTREIARLSGRSQSDIAQLIRNGKFFWIERKVDTPARDAYLAIDDPSIGYTYDLNRQYNMYEIFHSFIGTCDLDNGGIEGLELQLNDILTGTSGFTIYQRDPMGDIFPYHNYQDKEPLAGCDVYLTIDLQLQSILHAHLKECLMREDAQYAAGLIIHPTTGEILAMVNVCRNGNQRNHIVCDEFEPGSTFKLVTLAYALTNGVKENDVFTTNGGKITIRGHTINDYKNYGTITFRQAIAHSSNVAMVKVAKTFDHEEFFLLVRDFGFGQVSGIELPGEVAGRIPNPQHLNEIEFATLAFGQGLTVNLVQLAFAYQAIANGGVLVKPIIVREIKDGKKTIYRAKPLRIRRIIDKDVAERMTDVLCSVVEEGSGTEAAIEGVRIAGKTGTAQKVINGRYSNSSIITTFIGYFPAEKPDYVIALLLDEPKKGLWASAIAAPVFRDIAQSIYRMNSHQYAAK